jgi:hypothetical protein
VLLFVVMRCVEPRFLFLSLLTRRRHGFFFVFLFVL